MKKRFPNIDAHGRARKKENPLAGRREAALPLAQDTLADLYYYFERRMATVRRSDFRKRMILTGIIHAVRTGYSLVVDLEQGWAGTGKGQQEVRRKAS